MAINIASGDDYVPVQVGRIHHRSETSERRPDQDTTDTPAAGRTVNIRTGNATVGQQADVIDGDLVIGW